MHMHLLFKINTIKVRKVYGKIISGSDLCCIIDEVINYTNLCIVWSCLETTTQIHHPLQKTSNQKVDWGNAIFRTLKVTSR